MLGSLRKEREVEMENMRNALERTRQEKRDEEMREMAKVRKMQQDEFERLQNKKRDNYEKMIKWRVENETNLKFKEQQRLDQVCASGDLAEKKEKNLEGAFISVLGLTLPLHEALRYSSFGRQGALERYRKRHQGRAQLQLAPFWRTGTHTQTHISWRKDRRRHTGFRARE